MAIIFLRGVAPRYLTRSCLLSKRRYLWRLKRIEPITQHSVGIWITRTKLNSIVFKIEIVLECQCFVVFSLPVLHPHLVCIVVTAMTTPLPVFVVHKRSSKRFHAFLIKSLLFVLNVKMSTKLTILNVTVPFHIPLLTLKLNH